MSTSTHPFIILSDSDIEDAFSYTDYTPALLDYSPATSGNTAFDFETESDPSEDPFKDRSTLVAITPFPDDPYMQIRRAYYATNEESSNSSSSSTIPPPPAPPFRYHPNGMTFIHTARKRVHTPQAPTVPPPVLPPPLVLPSLPLSHPRDSVPEEIIPPRKRAHFLSPPSSSTDLSTPPREEQIDAILNHLDEFPLERIEQIEDGIEGLVNGQMRHDDEVVLARIRISTLEVLIEDIQVTMALLPPGFLEPLYPGIMDMINAQDIEHMIPPTPTRDTEPNVGSPIPSSPSSSVGSSSPVRSTTPPPDYPFDESIFADLDNSLWIIPRPLGSEPVPEEPNEPDAC
ncbi:hypothetical protein Tco_0045921 [Tanacetum coccineum]